MGHQLMPSSACACSALQSQDILHTQTLVRGLNPKIPKGKALLRVSGAREGLDLAPCALCVLLALAAAAPGTAGDSCHPCVIRGKPGTQNAVSVAKFGGAWRAWVQTEGRGGSKILGDVTSPCPCGSACPGACPAHPSGAGTPIGG